jgi:predicted transcriptional regulator
MDDHPPPGGPDDNSSAVASSSEAEARRDELRAAVKRGIEEIEEGRVVDLEAAFERIESMLDELEAARRP